VSANTDARILDTLGVVLAWLVAHGEATMVVLGVLVALVVAGRVAYNVAWLWHDLRLRRHGADAAGALAAYLGRDAAGRSGEYQSYMQSDAWRARSERTLLLAGGACQRCGRRRATAAHHLTYDRLGRELDADLIAVCRRCHRQLHGR
jgi:HNH endonuclease